jgi:preprotein translocase subunit SecB
MPLEEHFVPSAAAYVDSSDFHVVPERIFLVQSSFADRSGPADEPDSLSDNVELLISLGLHRLSKYRLTVAVSAAYAGEDAPFDLAVTYAAQFRMHDTVPSDAVEELWEYIARDLAVKLLYPYLRQAVSELTEKWRGDKVYLPFIPIPLELEDDEEFVVPLPADGTQVTMLDELKAG